MANQPIDSGKRTFYKILQLSEDADNDAISASYQRLKAKYANASDETSRNEQLFIEHAYQVLSNPSSRSSYDQQITQANIKIPTPVSYQYVNDSSKSWFSSLKILLVSLIALALVWYGLSTRHTEELNKISVSKETVVGSNDNTRIGVEGSVQNTSKALDVASEIAQRQIDVQRQDADTRRMEAESRIKANEDRIAAQAASQKAITERAERCQYMNSMIRQANAAGAYEEARALQIRGCN